MSVNEIKDIRSKTTVPLEFFVHGALCVSYSGQCYLSHVIGHRSANRGACAQPCRLKWNLEDENGNTLIANRHLLSLRDMNNSKNLEELIDAGISSLKIEGRLKDADYVKNTTAFYRQALDEIIARRPDISKSSKGISSPSFVPNLEKSFSRGFTDYFLHGRQKNIDSPFTPKSMGEYIGEIKKIDGKRMTVKLKEGITLHNGDGLCFLDENNELQGFNVNGVENDTILSSAPLSFRAPQVRGISLYRNYDIQWQRSVDASTGNRKIAINLELSETSDGFRLSSENVSVSLQCQKDIAKNPEKALETIRTKLSQWGDTKFVVKNIDIQLDTMYFIPASILGEMKRQLVVELESSFRLKHNEVKRNGEISVKQKHCDIQLSELSPLPAVGRNDGLGDHLSYLGNVTNSLSRQFYENHGIAHIDDGLEKTTPDGEIVVMTTKHCIRYANGMCAKETGKPASPLYISNDRGRFRLDFDCKNCCMKVVNI